MISFELNMEPETLLSFDLTQAPFSFCKMLFNIKIYNCQYLSYNLYTALKNSCKSIVSMAAILVVIVMKCLERSNIDTRSKCVQYHQPQVTNKRVI